MLMSSFMAAPSCCKNEGWTERERNIINSQEPVMRVLTVDSPEDSLTLHTPSKNLGRDLVRSKEYKTLEQKMLNTVTAPQYDGVGIAGPQVGILRRIVAVQRFDKNGEPFEVYPDIHIVETRGEKEPGPEGCLSVPERKGNVLRYKDITVKYLSPVTMEDTTETITGFTAVIFQHECDHLDGVVYTDILFPD